MIEKPNHCPYCGRFTGVDPDGYYDTAEKGADPETGYVAAFCNEKCACKHHGRPVPTDYWKPAKAAA